MSHRLQIDYKHIANKRNHFQAGATLAEALYILPIFFIIIFGMIEMTFIYKAKNTLNLATQEAVRKGTLNNAEIGSIKIALSQGMAPLFAGKETCPGNLALATGVKCAGLIQASMETAIGKYSINGTSIGPVSILSPTKEIFDAFKVKYKKLPGDPELEYIPNDNLKWRSPDTKKVLIGGSQRDINIQDANLLKIKTFWCHKLSVPGLDLVFYNTILRHNSGPEQYYCNKLSQDTTASSASNLVFKRARGYYIAIKSHAIARMQSPVLSGNTLLSSKDVEDVVEHTVPTGSENEIDSSNPGGSTECDPTVETCPPTDGECDPATETCPPTDECDPAAEACEEECPENYIPNPSIIGIDKCIVDPVYCALNPADTICPCDTSTPQNFSPISNTSSISFQ